MGMYNARAVPAFVGMALLGLTSTGALAAPITVPTVLNPGDQYRLAFVTSTTRDATSSIIADYDAHVTAAANSVTALSELGTNWRVIGSTSSVDARDHTSTVSGTDGAGIPIFLLNDTRLAADYADLWDGSIENRLRIDEAGKQLASVHSFTGSSPSGTMIPLFALGNFFTAYGNTLELFTRWINAGGASSDIQGRFYGISDILTVESAEVAEPGSLGILALGLLGLGIVLRKRAVPGAPASEYP